MYKVKNVSKLLLTSCIALLSFLATAKAQQRMPVNLRGLDMANSGGNLMHTITKSLSLDVTSARYPVQFSDVSDFANEKLLPGYFRVRIDSNVPWVLTAFINGTATPSDPTENMRILTPITRTGIQLTSSPQVILEGNGLAELIEYSLDVKLPVPLNVAQGMQIQQVTFQISER